MHAKQGRTTTSASFNPPSSPDGVPQSHSPGSRPRFLELGPSPTIPGGVISRTQQRNGRRGDRRKGTVDRAMRALPHHSPCGGPLCVGDLGGVRETNSRLGETQMEHILNHERLDAYGLALQVARWIRTTRFPTGDSALRDQAKRAADSMVLNIAEGCSRQGGDRHRHFTIAAGSAAEACAVLDLVDLPDGAERQRELRRVVAMTSRLR